MGIRNLNWYNLQATRRYPLDDLCSSETDAGDSFPDDILVDLHVRFNSALGQYAYIQAVTVSEHLVTAIIGVSSTIDTAGTSVAAVTITKPAAINVNYAIEPLVAGVVGWVVFGAGINALPIAARFSTPRQSLIAARCARGYDPLPIPAISKLNVVPPLQGVVNINSETPIKIEHKTEMIGGVNRQLVIFSLNKEDASLTYNPLSYFLSACGQRPESGTCGKTPIETINGIAPDCDGNIQITFNNITAVPFASCGGIDLLTDYGLKRACAGPEQLPLFYSDLCCPRRFDTIADRNAAPADEFNVGDIVRVGVSSGASTTKYQYYRVTAINAGAVVWSANPLAVDDPDLKTVLSKCDWPDPTELLPDIVINLPQLQDYPALSLPACIDFCSCDPTPPLFDAVQGVFASEKLLAPFGCVPCGAANTAQQQPRDRFALSLRNTYSSVDTGGVALSLLKNTATDWAFGRAISAQLKIAPTGVDRNGGVVINYRKVVRNSVTQIKYYAAVIDVGRGQFSLLEYVNNNYIIVASVPMLVQTSSWYRITVYPTLRGDFVYLNCVAEEMAPNGVRAEIIDYRVLLRDYEPQTGAFGLYALRSYTRFNAFTIT